MLDRRRRLRPIGIAVSAVLVLLALFLAAKGDDGGDAAVAGIAPHFVEAADLVELEGSLGHPVYWAGERPPDQLELSEEADGSLYLRYLPPGVEAGDPRPGFLTVGTYPVVDAVAALRRTATEAGVKLGRAAGVVVLPNPGSSGSVYLAHPGTDLQIEVYDPAPGAALRLIRSGAIGPVG
jgi:hypothetical protein